MDNLRLSSMNCFTVASLDRMGTKRRVDTWVAKQLKKPTTCFVPVWRSMNLFSREDKFRPVLPSYTDLGDLIDTVESLTFLGQEDKVAYFATGLPSSDNIVPDAMIRFGEFKDLRKVGVMIDGRENSLLAYARAITYWHQRNRFCGDCGSPTSSAEGGHMLVCTNKQCLQQHFPRTDPAIIVLVTFGENCLLGRQAIWPEKWYSTIAGFVDPGESIENSVVREVLEETGIQINKVFYHSSQPWPFPGSVMLGFTAEAGHNKIMTDLSELEDARWFSRMDMLRSLKKGSLRLPPRISIAYRLIEDWFNAGNLGRLEKSMDGVWQAKEWESFKDSS